MIFNYRYFSFCLLILVATFISSSTAAFCSNLTSTDDKDSACFLEPPTYNPGRLRSSGNSLVLPCHVARSKRSTVEWWYQDFDKTVNIKIYPVFPAVRPTVLRFITSPSILAKNSTETDILDVSVLLRHVNVDDSGIFTCVIRPWTTDPLASIDNSLTDDYSDLPTLSYYVDLTGPRLCQTSISLLPCFSNMRSSSPTTIDAYQTAFLQCVVQNHNRPVSVFWVVGNAPVNSVLITDFLTTNQNNGDRLRRVFPLSPYDYSIEITINRDTPERAYSCVIEGAGDVEATLFTYVVRSIDLEDISDKKITVRKNETRIANETTSIVPPKLVPHDALTSDQVDELRQKQSPEHPPKKHGKKSHIDDENDDDDSVNELEDLDKREQTTIGI